jgi:CRISPR-associated endonuclease/helicase Cas3
MWQSRRSEAFSFEVIPFKDCPAKTYLQANGTTVVGRSVVNHCQIVGEVARELVARYPASLRENLFPEGAALAASAHDIGKVSPYFVEKIRRACDFTDGSIPARTGINPALEAQWGGHAGVSQLTAKSLHAPQFVPEILGEHHGFAPPLSGRRAHDECSGGAAWQQERAALVAELKSCLGTDWPQIASIPQARLLAGLTSVSDWIGAGEFFEDPSTPWRDNVARALDAAGFIRPEYQEGLSFRRVFGFEPRPAQAQLIETVTDPGVYVLEAPMGLGKTEAALYAAYRMVSTGKACGIYFALPTQLTSNKIYERFNRFLRAILAPDSRHRSLLLHGTAWLLDTDMGEEGRPGGAWFNHAKRGLLAPFAVGTTDQALMGAMNVKHGFVRAFGLAGKVVILDEVHTYDAYTGTLLDALVALLRKLHCTVIILSATLNRDRRQQLVGRDLNSDGYPLITTVVTHPVREAVIPVHGGQRVMVRLVERDGLAIQEALDRASAGQQVLWIENTVADAQQRYLDLAARASELRLACGLLHSRFTAHDRHQIEERWINLFGTAGWGQRHEQGRILVGTQVLEQSLDIDADFIVTRFAPTDMLLQRIGRLWRHADTPRAAAAVCETWLLAPDLHTAIATPHAAFGPSASVYSPYVPCRSLEVWRSRSGELCLPQDIRPLIEQTYRQREEMGPMAQWLSELDDGTCWRIGRGAMGQLARITLAEGAATLPESKAQSRYSDTESRDVLLLRGWRHEPDKKASRLTLLNGKQVMLPWRRHSLNKREWRTLAAELMRQLVTVRDQDAPQPLPTDLLEKHGFGHCFYLGNAAQGESGLCVALVDEGGTLQSAQGALVHNKYALKYRHDLGYQVVRKQGQG